MQRKVDQKIPMTVAGAHVEEQKTKTWENATPEDVNDFGELIQSPASEDEARQKKVRAFTVRYQIKSDKEGETGWTGEKYFLPGELCHPEGTLKLRTGWSWEEIADTRDAEFAQAVVAANGGVLISWRWEERFATEISRGIYVQPTSESRSQEIWEEKDKRERHARQVAENIAGDSIHRMGSNGGRTG